MTLKPLLCSITIIVVVAVLGALKGLSYDYTSQPGRFSSQTVADYSPANGCE